MMNRIEYVTQSRERVNLLQYADEVSGASDRNCVTYALLYD